MVPHNERISLSEILILDDLNVDSNKLFIIFSKSWHDSGWKSKVGITFKLKGVIIKQNLLAEGIILY